jgi:hypothetical protein
MDPEDHRGGRSEGGRMNGADLRALRYLSAQMMLAGDPAWCHTINHASERDWTAHQVLIDRGTSYNMAPDPPIEYTNIGCAICGRLIATIRRERYAWLGPVPDFPGRRT